MRGRPVFLSHPSSLEHDPGPHPEQPARITAIKQELESRGWLGWECRQSPAVEREALERVHRSGYIDALERISARGGAQLDPDTAMSRGSFEAAVRGSGGAVALVESLLGGDAPTGFSVHRPPGHHALADQPMGFCLFNHVAVAARHAVEGLGLQRVMILDWDVHHGNGTEATFAEDPRVMFCSIHQWPLYPLGSGPAGFVGTGAGAGTTVNLPVPAGAGDLEFRSLVERVAVPLARAFVPQLILISAGFDAHAGDPLADCAVSDAGYGEMAAAMAAAGSEIGAPVGAVLEGGYALGPLARSVAATMEGLAGARAPKPAGETELSESARARVGRFWPVGD